MPSSEFILEPFDLDYMRIDKFTKNTYNSSIKIKHYSF